MGKIFHVPPIKMIQRKYFYVINFSLITIGPSANSFVSITPLLFFFSKKLNKLHAKVMAAIHNRNDERNGLQEYNHSTNIRVISWQKETGLLNLS